MQYSQACAYLDNLQLFKIKLGLGAMKDFMASLGDPQTTYPCIHLAGTNGKGSVGAVLVTLLAAAGYRIGFYSSPHLTSVRERFRINHTCISKEAFAQTASKLKDRLGDNNITYFEFTTALAFLWFHTEQVDIAVIETGLGGRLDATNILSPLVAAVTSVDLDHQEHLGTSLKEIAVEKAGIIKPAAPTVIGNLPPAAKEVIVKTCKQRGSQIFSYKYDFTTKKHLDGSFDYSGIQNTYLPGLRCGLIGEHQVENAAVALAVVECLQEKFRLSHETIRQFLPKVQWAGRMEALTVATEEGMRYCLLDGAHNEAGVRALMDTLETRYRDSRVFLLWGSMADKELGDTWTRLLAAATLTIFTQAEPKRSATPEQLVARVPLQYRNLTKAAESVEDALQTAFRESTPDDLIVIAGSLYLVGRIRPILIEAAAR